MNPSQQSVNNFNSLSYQQRVMLLDSYGHFLIRDLRGNLVMDYYHIEGCILCAVWQQSTLVDVTMCDYDELDVLCDSIELTYNGGEQHPDW